MMRQQPPQNRQEADGVYAFDLKLNVDFNSKHLSLGLPNQVPFSKKVYVPLSNCPPPAAYSPPPQYLPIDPEASIRTTAQLPPRSQVTQVQYYQQVQTDLGAPLQHKNSESMNTTSFRVQSSPQAIDCVICERTVRREEFSLHLEEHRSKRKDKSRSSVGDSEVSIRNKNSEAEIADIVTSNQPQSISVIPHSLNFSQSNIVSNPQVAYERSSTIIPGVNELILNSSNQFQMSRPANHSYPSNHSNHSNHLNSHSQTSFYLSHSSLGQEQPPPSFHSSSSRVPLPIINQSQYSLSQRQNVINEAPIVHMPAERDINTLHFHRIESMIIRPEAARVEMEIDACGQSIISRNSIPTRYSEIYALEHQLQERRFSQPQQDSSSSDEESVKVYPSKSYRSGFTPQPELQRSTYTEKLSKTKLPVNYLAREEFITTSTHNTNSKKSKALS